MSRDPIRDKIVGLSMDQDRLWVLRDPGGTEYAITDYNDEMTGFDPRLAAIDPAVFRCGGNAYYATGRWAAEHGWRVEEREDRR